MQRESPHRCKDQIVSPLQSNNSEINFSLHSCKQSITVARNHYLIPHNFYIARWFTSMLEYQQSLKSDDVRKITIAVKRDWTQLKLNKGHLAHGPEIHSSAGGPNFRIVPCRQRPVQIFLARLRSQVRGLTSPWEFMETVLNL